MAIKDAHTEELIKETAKRVFFKEGRFHATTQEIADAAGVNRALIHYYFRSRDQLLEVIIKEGVLMMHLKLKSIVNSEVEFKDKIDRFLDILIEESLEFPYNETFIITEMNKNPNSKMLETLGCMKDEVVEVFAQYIRDEIEAISPTHFMVNLMSLVAYPLVSKPLLSQVFKWDKQDFNQFMKERKEVILNLVFKK
jgi:AcrR family transcriptional regulator